MNLKRAFPVLENLKSYERSSFQKDLFAGITVAVMLVPQGMAYAMLAGVPPIYGLYGGLVPLLIYALLGTSRQMSIGPVAVSSLLLLAGISQITEPFEPEYITLVIFTGLLIGLIQTSLGLMKLGFLVNFISHPVIIGFTSAAAIIIAITQLKDLLGFDIPRFDQSYKTFLYAIDHISETHWLTFFICVGSILLIIILRKLNKNLPGPLIVVIIGTLMVYLGGDKMGGVAIVQEVPQGLPTFSTAFFSLADIPKLIPTVLTVTVIGIVESISIAKVLQGKHQHYKIKPNQELIALGFSKMLGSFFQSLPTSGSFTRSAVNNEAGAMTGVASIVSAVIIGLVLLLLTPLFYYLPKAVLAGIIILSVKSLFELGEAEELWKNHRSDFYMMITTFLVTLLLGIEVGVLAGVALSIMAILYKSSKPHMAVLGKLPNSNSFRNIDRFDKAARTDGVLIVRFDDQLYFANASYFTDSLQALVEQERELQSFILDASSMHAIDSSGSTALREFRDFLLAKGIVFKIAGMVGPVRDVVKRIGLMEEMGKECYYLNVKAALEDEQGHIKNDLATQSNNTSKK